MRRSAAPDWPRAGPSVYSFSIMNFRPHRPADHEAIAGLRWRIKSDDSGEIEGAGRAAFVAAYRRHLAEADARGDTVHWLAESGGAPVAVMTVRTVRKEPSPGQPPGRWGYLTNCYVLPEQRDRGVGARLLDRVARWARAEGLELLIVWPSERAFPFYRRAGFRGTEAPLELMLE